MDIVQKLLAPHPYSGIVQEHEIEAANEIKKLRKWVFATARSLEQSGLSIDEYNAITRSVIDAR